MAENTKIEWADHTFNPWVGCTKVSPACDHCYAESWAKRAGSPELWTGQRRRTKEANWQKAIKWNREAARLGIRYRVFCASLADVFDNQVPTRWRDDLWHWIELTPHLDWLLLTKRPQNIAKFLPDPRTGVKPWDDGWPNVWLGTTAENQTELNRRAPHLARVPAAVRFLSCEPLLDELDLTAIRYREEDAGIRWNALTAEAWVENSESASAYSNSSDGVPRLDWIIAGGESGPGARPMHPAWARKLRDDCTAAGVPFLFKQWGDWHPHQQPLADGSINALGNPDDLHGRWHSFGDGQSAWRTGKMAAGRFLDGATYDGFPQVQEAA